MAEVRFLRPAATFLKKLKDKQLKERFKKAIGEIQQNPFIGEAKKQDLSGIYCYDVYYRSVNYEIAYIIEEVTLADGSNQVVVIIMAGTRENFYEQLKKYMK